MINSLKIQLSGAIIITDSDQLEQIKHHNKKPKAQSIISSMNGMKFQTPIPGLLNTNADTTKKENNTATTTTITFVTITTNNTTRFQYAWWDTQGYTVRIDDFVSFSHLRGIQRLAVATAAILVKLSKPLRPTIRFGKKN